MKEANVQSIMTAYNAFNGIPPSGSTWLLEDVLRKEWDLMVLLYLTVVLLES